MITGKTKLAAVIGWPIEHTKSPQMLNAAFGAAGVDAVLVPMAIEPQHLAAAITSMRTIGVIGASVTVPHKIAAVASCDELSAAAKATGAVNCLQFVDGRVVGNNTDADGFLDGLTASGFDLRGKRVVILGAGGAARAIAYAVRGGRAIEVVARDPSKVTWATAWPWDPEHLRDTFARADLVVDTTPVALAGSPQALAEEVAWVDSLPLASLRPHTCVASLVYHRVPRLLERAAVLGYSTLDGRAMLVHQGARAFTLWTGVAAPIEIMRTALEQSIVATV
ncbi:shikimate dehydrogenase [soil metagenome]